MDEIAVDETELAPMSAAEEACDHFRLEVLPHLVTPDFIHQLTRVLTACETRLRLTGNRELAEVAFVNRSLFEAAPPEIVAFHPMIQTIGIETLRILVEDIVTMTDGREEVKGILSDVLAQDDLDQYLPQSSSVFSRTGLEDTDKIIAPKPDAVASSLLEMASEGTTETETEDPSPTPNSTDVQQSMASERFPEPEPVADQATAPTEPPPPRPEAVS